MTNKEIQKALSFMWNNNGKYSCPVCEDNEICMTGCTNCDMAKNLIILQQAIDDLEIIDKAFDLICMDMQKIKKVDGDNSRGQNYFRTHYYMLAKEELKNENKNGKI